MLHQAGGGILRQAVLRLPGINEIVRIGAKGRRYGACLASQQQRRGNRQQGGALHDPMSGFPPAGVKWPLRQRHEEPGCDLRQKLSVKRVASRGPMPKSRLA
jgi:hypothetical protein